jgi:hypothetical protein
MLFAALYDKLRLPHHSMTPAVSTKNNVDLQRRLEELGIVERVVEALPAAPTVPQKKHLSRKQRLVLEQRRRAREKLAEPVHTRERVVYVAGKHLALLREFPFIGAVINAFARSVVHQGGPCALHIKRGIFVAPPRFGLTVPALEKAFDKLREVAHPIAGTDGNDSAIHNTASIRLNASGTVLSGRASLVTKRLMTTLHAFDDFGMHSMRVIAGVLARWSRFGFAESANASKLLEAIKDVLARPKLLQEKKHILSVFYKPGGVLEGHIDTTSVATFITTRTPNDDRETLLNLADMGSQELKYTIGYHRWDLVFFPADVWHQTSAYSEPREIMNLFY